MADNVELSEMIKLLNLQFKDDNQDLTYENIVLANDADNDGGHIARIIYWIIC
jgi:DNA gyrase/topoisomerase IV subunit B